MNEDLMQQLNFKRSGQGRPILLIHGLFGSLDNLNSLAQKLNKDYDVIQIDLRNHGKSFHHIKMNYDVMAEDVIRLIDALGLEQITLIGHSMGGKVAMKLATLFPNKIDGLIVLDIAPVSYQENRHLDVFKACEVLVTQQATSRNKAMEILHQSITEEGVAPFIGKSLYCENGIYLPRFNFSIIQKEYNQIMTWEEAGIYSGPCLFIKGQNSDYIKSSAQEMILKQFPLAKAHIIANAGHWIHAQKPQETLRAIHHFLDKKKN